MLLYHRQTYQITSISAVPEPEAIIDTFETFRLVRQLLAEHLTPLQLIRRGHEMSDSRNNFGHNAGTYAVEERPLAASEPRKVSHSRRKNLLAASFILSLFTWLGYLLGQYTERTYWTTVNLETSGSRFKRWGPAWVNLNENGSLNSTSFSPLVSSHCSGWRASCAFTLDGAVCECNGSRWLDTGPGIVEITSSTRQLDTDGARVWLQRANHRRLSPSNDINELRITYVDAVEDCASSAVCVKGRSLVAKNYGAVTTEGASCDTEALCSSSSAYSSGLFNWVYEFNNGQGTGAGAECSVDVQDDSHGIEKGEATFNGPHKRPSPMAYQGYAFSFELPGILTNPSTSHPNNCVRVGTWDGPGLRHRWSCDFPSSNLRYTVNTFPYWYMGSEAEAECYHLCAGYQPCIDYCVATLP